MSQRGRRDVVALVWIAVGVLLIWRGLPYAGWREPASIDPGYVPLAGTDQWIAAGLALLLGLGKGFTALRKGARRAARQIVDRGEDAPPWTVFSPAMILLVGLMVGAGLALRLSPYDEVWKGWIIGVLYPAIGVALIIGGWLARSIAPLDPR